jgi:serine/threonine protein kinase
MPRIPNEYWRTHGALHDPRKVVCEWNYLAYRKQWSSSSTIVSDVPVPADSDILKLLADLAKTMAVLHRHDIVLGDVSGRNLLWTDQPATTVFIIDCDAFRPQGHDAVNPPKESPDWGDPAVERSATTTASDVYKLGLAAYRALWSATAGRPPANLTPKDGVPDTIIDLILRSMRLEGRPTADEWARELTMLASFSGRPVVRLDRTPQPAPSPHAPAPSGTPRPAPSTDPGSPGTGRPSIPVR